MELAYMQCYTLELGQKCERLYFKWLQMSLGTVSKWIN